MKKRWCLTLLIFTLFFNFTVFADHKSEPVLPAFADKILTKYLDRLSKKHSATEQINKLLALSRNIDKHLEKGAFSKMLSYDQKEKIKEVSQAFQNELLNMQRIENEEEKQKAVTVFFHQLSPKKKPLYGNYEEEERRDRPDRKGSIGKSIGKDPYQEIPYQDAGGLSYPPILDRDQEQIDEEDIDEDLLFLEDGGNTFVRPQLYKQGLPYAPNFEERLASKKVVYAGWIVLGILLAVGIISLTAIIVIIIVAACA